MEPEHLEWLSSFPVFLHLLRCVVGGAAGVCKRLFKGQICRLVDHPTLHLPVPSAVSPLMSSLLVNMRVDRRVKCD